MVVERERSTAAAHGVPEIADDLLLVLAPQELLTNSSFPTDAADFLTSVGLPSSSAPFLSFDAVGDGPQTLLQRYDIQPDGAYAQDSRHSLYVIGSDSAGNPLCVDAARGGAIFMLDHEDDFRTRTFVASSVGSLANALLLVYTVPHSQFADHLREVDSQAAAPASFLPIEVAMMADVE